MRVHLEGMGVVGSLLALRLAREGVDFTWHDIDLLPTAWRASTGCIYPGHSAKFGPDHACYVAWQDWFERDALYAPWTEAANYVYCTKSPPHGGRYASTQTEHGLRVAGVPSYHLNAQKLVHNTRIAFEDLRRDESPMLKIGRGIEPFQAEGVDHYIVTHGFGLRLGHVYWGWTRFVKLAYDYRVYGPGRPCFYFRPNKFQMAYAYPVPGTPWWYAGSSIIMQKTSAMKSLSMPDKYARWKRDFERLANGAATVTEESDYAEGWRPASRDEAWLQSKGNVHSLRPLWNSGIRHFPRSWALLAQALHLPTTAAEEACL